MTDPIDGRARRAGEAIHEQTARMSGTDGLDDVLRRARRPRAATVIGLVLVALVAAPAIGWLLATNGQLVELAEQPAAPTPTPSPVEAEPTPTPTPDTAQTPPATPTPPAEPTPTPTPGLTPLGTYGTDEATGDLPPADTLALLTDVRVGSHPGFDRVVLEFGEGGTSPYRVAYEDPPFLSAGAGEPVPVEGEAFLEVRLLSATGVDFDTDAAEGYRLTYDGPDRVAGDTTLVTEVVRTGDFEATLSWIIGLRAPASFAVEVLDNPVRLVIDIETR